MTICDVVHYIQENKSVHYIHLNKVSEYCLTEMISKYIQNIAVLKIYTFKVLVCLLCLSIYFLFDFILYTPNDQ